MKECPVCSRCFPDSVNHCPTDGDALRFTIQGDTVLDGRYQLEKRLGQGGMGIVFKARHIFLKTQHAIKIILPDLVGNDPTLATRFRQEAMAAAAIHHPNTVSVTDYGVIGGTTPFIVMEFIKGRSLHDLITTEERLAPARALEIILAVSEGVAAAHAQGIIHRDLKPLNVVLKEGARLSESVKVLDFGLAKIKSGELLGSFVVAQTQGMMGSPLYMAPEQWGDDEPDARADIYSLGVILYQLLAGDVPFKGNSVPSIMNKHLTAQPAPLAECGVEVPPEVEQVVRHALEKDPAKRPQTVEEFIGELRTALSSVAPLSELDAAGLQTIALTTGGDTQGIGRPPSHGEEGAADVRDASGASPGTGFGGTPTGPVAVEPPPQQSSAPQQSSSAPPVVGRTTEPPTGEPRTEVLPGSARGAARSSATTPLVTHAPPVTSAIQTPAAVEASRPAEPPPLPPPPQEQPTPRDEAFNPAATRRITPDEGARAQSEAETLRQAAEAAEAEARRRREADAQKSARRDEEAAAPPASPATGPFARPQDDEAPAAPPDASAQIAPTLVQPTPAPAPGTPTLKPPVPTPAPDKPTTYDVPPPPPSPGPRLVLAALVIVGLLAGAAALAFFLRGQSGSLNTNNTPPVQEVSPGPQPTAAPAAPTRPDLVALPGGTLQLGRADVPPNLGSLPARAQLWFYSQWPAHPVNVKAFAIDRTEVTNAEYAEFVAATGYPPPPGIWEGNHPKQGQERWPVRNVTLEDALRFAVWRSRRDGVTYRLPNEEEWEYAARGAGKFDLYPWGGEWADGRAVLGTDTPQPVGSRPAGATPQGVQDMLGNVWEWTTTEASMYRGNNRTALAAENRGHAVIRGGSYQSSHDGDEAATATARRFVARDKRDPVLGFRLVRDGQ